MNKERHTYSLRAYLTYISRYKFRIGVVFVGFVLSFLMITLLPLFIGKLVGALAADPIDKGAALRYLWLLIGLSLGHTVLWHVSELIYMKFLNPVVIAYENILFRQVIDRPYLYFVDKFTGKLSSYITTVGREAKDFTQNFFYNYTTETVRLVSVTVIISSVNWQTGIVFCGGLILMFVVGRYSVQNSLKYEKQWTDVESTKNGKIIDTVANFVNVKSFQKETAETDAIHKEQDKNITASNRAFIWSVFFWATMGAIVRILIWPATIALNVYLYLEQQITLSDLTIVLSAILLFSESIWNIVWQVSQFGLRLARMEEAYTYLFGPTNIVQNYFDKTDRRIASPAFTRELSLQKLHFSYPDKPDTEVLQGINLTIKKGEKIGIVGKSGSGKTTLTKLLLGYYPLSESPVLLDGVLTRTDELARLISYVPQDTSLFHRSIADNIAYAADRDASRAEIVRAAVRAHADEFIRQITDGYDALVGERGVKLSAGQRQRIAIARAYLDDKPVLILDEATSALDSESEILVQKALEDLWQDKTVIAIAHRLSTLRNMDRIIVMDRGRIVEQGSHKQLLSQKGTYAKLWSHQSGGFIEE